jgi:GntR family transcriptional repressor for pyruvate dehydrogenase complex
MTEGGQQRVRRPRAEAGNAYDTVAAGIQAAILLGELPPGTRLPDETELAERYGVGRSTIREALRVLSGRGWVHTTRGPSGGVFVSQPDPQAMGRDLGNNLAFLVGGASLSFAEVLEARQVHEATTTRLAARRAGPAEVERIRRLAEDAMHLAADPDAFTRVNVEFHLALSEAAHNRLLLLWMWAMRQVLEDVMHTAASTRERRVHAAEQHLAIASAIAAGDADAAVAAMNLHLNDFEVDYLKLASRRPDAERAAGA